MLRQVEWYKSSGHFTSQIHSHTVITQHHAPNIRLIHSAKNTTNVIKTDTFCR